MRSLKMLNKNKFKMEINSNFHKIQMLIIENKESFHFLIKITNNITKIIILIEYFMFKIQKEIIITKIQK